MKYLLSLFVVLFFLAGCSGGPVILPHPPAAKVGDVMVTVNVQAKGHKDIPNGSHVIVTLADVRRSGDGLVALAGDSIAMSQPDSGVRITFPADKNKISQCNQSQACALIVQVVKGQQVLLSNTVPVPYKTGQTKTVVYVEG